MTVSAIPIVLILKCLSLCFVSCGCGWFISSLICRWVINDSINAKSILSLTDARIAKFATKHQEVGARENNIGLICKERIFSYETDTEVYNYIRKR